MLKVMRSMKIEVLGAERRRRWRHEDKIRIVEESFAPGTVVCDVARRHEIANSLLFSWRRQAREGRLGGGGAETGFVPVTISEADTKRPVSGDVAARSEASPRTSRHACGLIEIDLGDGRCVRVDRTVDADALGRVLDVLDRR
ncbi:MAG: IS66 family insertion sequence hypothetical protein [Mesorhizobium sp.]|nr:MAG: IS66 family insertion sequence hypothetical protein [Mesorhizobium sp.]RWC40747.1 MAG: IS66 family insertion sequence hypothetical protein [Mesorhizobium sp.]RWF76657.1 MAG: IS66 family insertion sequence hypothetical protein [Mesorhizobium sp.]